MSINKKLIEAIKSNELIKRYKELEVIINSNASLLKQMDELKTIQKEIVHAEKLAKPEILKQIRERYNDKLTLIESYPLMSEYLDLQAKINDDLQGFKDVIEQGINSDLSLK